MRVGGYEMDMEEMMEVECVRDEWEVECGWDEWEVECGRR